MASPAFVYAFDNLTPDKFVELCGLLLGARYKGFLLSSSGPDGGVDGEQDPILGKLIVEEKTVLVDTLLPKDGLLVFQFKHKVVARVGESQSRTSLLNHFRTNNAKKSEVLKNNVVKLKPQGYVLVTNIEVNSNYRQKFIELCKEENPDIENYQIIGLDELESWVISERNIRSQYFPLLYGRPKFNLKLKLATGITFKVLNPEELYRGGHSDIEPDKKILSLSVMNIGERTSYISSIKFKVLIDGKINHIIQSPMLKGIDPLSNPVFGEALESGKCHEFRFYYKLFSDEFIKKEYFLSEVLVTDQIDTKYLIEVSEDIRNEIVSESQNMESYSKTLLNTIDAMVAEKNTH